MSDVAQRLAQVRARIEAACQRSGRDPQSVQLVAVSKFHSIEAMREAYAAGQRHFGENYAQELARKAQALEDLPDLCMHFIGGLQTNKAKLLAAHAHVVETLASVEAARALAQRLEKLNRSLRVLIQVNVAGEAQKSGLREAELPGLLEAIAPLSALEVCGLMTIPPADDPVRARAAYRRLRELAQAHGLSELSMGMSDDLEIAIEEGATTVRVGTAIFGPRPG